MMVVPLVEGIKEVVLFYRQSLCFILLIIIHHIDEVKCKELPSVCYDELVCSRAHYLYRESPFARECSSKKEGTKIKYTKDILDYLSPSFVAEFDRRYTKEQTEYKTSELEEQFRKDFFLTLIDIFDSKNNLHSSEVTSGNYDQWNYYLSDGVLATHLLKKFIGRNPTKVADDLSIVCNHWFNNGYKQKESRAPKTRKYIAQLKKKSASDIVIRKESAVCIWKKKLDEIYVINKIDNIANGQVPLYLSQVQQTRDLIPNELSGLDQSSTMVWAYHYLGQNTTISPPLFEMLSVFREEKFREVEESMYRISFKSESKSKQLKEFKEQLVKRSISTDLWYFGEMLTRFHSFLQGEFKQTDVYRHIPKKHVRQELDKIHFINMVDMTTHKKVMFSDSQSVKRLYYQMVDNPERSVQEKDEENQTLEDVYSNSLKNSEPFKLQENFLDKVFKMDLDEFFLLPHHFKTIISQKFSDIKLNKGHITYCLKYVGGYDFEVMRLSGSLLNKKMDKVIRFFTIHDHGGLSKTGRWFKRVLDSDVKTTEISNALNHPEYVVLMSMLDVHKRRGVCSADPGCKHGTMSSLIEDEMLSYAKMPSLHRVLSERVENINFIYESTFKHLEVWKEFIKKEYHKIALMSCGLRHDNYDALVPLFLTALEAALPLVDSVISGLDREYGPIGDESILDLKQNIYLRLILEISSTNLPIPLRDDCKYHYFTNELGGLSYVFNFQTSWF